MKKIVEFLSFQSQKIIANVTIMASVRMASLIMANVFKAKVSKNQAAIVKDDIFKYLKSV